MPYLYLMESNAQVGFVDNQITIKTSDGNRIRAIPITSVEGICVFGQPQLSTHLIRACISKNISVGYYSEDGRYFGNISSSQNINPMRQKRQVYLTDNRDFCLAWSKRIISAKIQNSLMLLTSMDGIYKFNDDELNGIRHSLEQIDLADSVDMALGFEGNAARCYFSCLSKLVTNDAFAFKGRSSRPPKDAFNSMLSFGYTLLYRNIAGAIERHGLHPYFAFMHKLHAGHIALASDLIEEYRAPLVDQTVISLVNDGEVEIDGFYTNDAGSIYMTRDTSRILTNKISDVITQARVYLADYGDRKTYGFQAMLDKKISSVVTAIECCDVDQYHPFIWK